MYLRNVFDIYPSTVVEVGIVSLMQEKEGDVTVGLG
jgi:hypothetical protein